MGLRAHARIVDDHIDLPEGCIRIDNGRAYSSTLVTIDPLGLNEFKNDIHIIKLSISFLFPLVSVKSFHTKSAS